MVFFPQRHPLLQPLHLPYQLFLFLVHHFPVVFHSLLQSLPHRLSTHRLLKQLSFRRHFFPLHAFLLAVEEQYPLARTVFTVPSGFSGQEYDESQQVRAQCLKTTARTDIYDLYYTAHMDYHLFVFCSLVQK